MTDTSERRTIPNKFILATLGAIALGAVTVGIVATRQIAQVEAPPPQPATPAPQIDAVTALGRLEPSGEVVKVSAPTSLSFGSARMEQLLVEEGDRVRQGQVVAFLDNRDRLQAAVDFARREVEVARANLAIVEAGAKQGEIDAQAASIERFQAQVEEDSRTQRATVERLQADLETSRSAQRATIDRLRAELANAQSDYQRFSQLAAEGVIATQELDGYQLDVETAYERLVEAQAVLERIERTGNEQLNEARATLERIERTGTAQVTEASATLERIAEVRPVDVDLARAQVERALASLAQAEADLDTALVRAPFAGQVLEIYARSGETTGEDGILDLGRTDRMTVVAEVYEADIGKVRMNQRATVTSETGAFTGELQGKVTQIGQQIFKQDVLDTDPAADVDARVVEVRILLDPTDSRQVEGLTNSKVVVKIHLGE